MSLLKIGISYEAVARYLQRLFIFQGRFFLLLLFWQVFKQRRAMFYNVMLYIISLQCTMYSECTAGISAFAK